jgi:hypothetical protein
MKIERCISIYKKTGKEEFVKEINADNIDISILKSIFIPFDDDPNFYRPYNIKESQYSILAKYIPELTFYSLDMFDIEIEAYNIG